MAYTIPNSADAAVAAIAAPDSVDFTIMTAASGRTGVESGLVATMTGSDMKVSLTAGVVWIDGRCVSVAAGTATIGAANATYPRFDLVCAGTAGTLSVAAGAASSNPAFPAVPSSSVALYSVYVAAAATAIASTRLTDKRVFIADPSDYLSYAFF